MFLQNKIYRTKNLVIYLIYKLFYTSQNMTKRKKN